MMAKEIWATVGAKVVLQREYTNGEFTFVALPEDASSVADQKQALLVNEAAFSLRKLGVSDQSMLRLMSKALSLSPRYRLDWY